MAIKIGRRTPDDPGGDNWEAEENARERKAAREDAAKDAKAAKAAREK